MPTTEARAAAEATRTGSNSAPLDASFESWGRYPKYKAHVVPMHWQQEFPANIAGLHTGVLAVGMGRSYGDSCLLKDGNLLVTTGMDRLIYFDSTSGLLTAEAGMTLAQFLDFAVPLGFFLPVTPGTKYVTLGGAIANDTTKKLIMLPAPSAATLRSLSWCGAMARSASARRRRIRTGLRRRLAGSD